MQKVTQLNVAQINAMRVVFAQKAVSKAVAITALIMHYNNIHEELCISGKLTVAYNINLLENALVRARNSKKFCVASYSEALVELHNPQTVVNAATDLLYA